MSACDRLRLPGLLAIVVLMPEELRKIDTSVLNKLVALNEEIQVLEGFCAKAEDLKGDVDPAVFQRVIADYVRRQAALEEDARPLRVEAAAVFEEFVVIHESFKRSREQALLEKQELEFRCRVGEFDEEEFRKQLGEAEAELARRNDDFDAAEAMRQRFLEVLEAETDVGTVPGAHTEEQDHTILAFPGDEPTNPGLPVEEIDRTIVARPGDGVADDFDQTMLAPGSVLMLDTEDATPQQFPLGVTNYVGSNSDNQICLSGRGVSRRHALITVSPSGLTITDLQSRNGTQVNGTRVAEQALVDGDRITIGEMTLVLRVG